ncbi:MAG: hypothetical protein JXB15_08120 [Anaerolineales bacterium]|nr:hypothetical protein [Anaerolineales bacterium]
MLRNPRIFSAILVISLLLASCGPKDTPEVAAEEFMGALLTMDGNKLAERTCVAQQANVQSTGLFLSAAAIIGQQATDQSLKADLSNIKYDRIAGDKNSAQVQVKGEIRTAILAVFQVTPIDTIKW